MLRVLGGPQLGFQEVHNWGFGRCINYGFGVSPQIGFWEVLH
jgi:hypothetical protein